MDANTNRESAGNTQGNSQTQTASQGQTIQTAPAKDSWGTRGVSLSELPIISGRDNRNQESGKPEVTETEPAKTDVNPEGTVIQDGKPETETVQEGADNTDGNAAKAVAELVAITGRKFKDSTELLTTYNESAKEAKRLYEENEVKEAAFSDIGNKLEMANKMILELQSNVGTGSFPETKTPDELATMGEEERMNYYFEKKQWQSKQEQFKKAIDSAKSESEDYAKRVTQQIQQYEKTMADNVEDFPDFTAVKDIREDILKQSSYLGNRPTTPYDTYLMAMGLKYMREKAESKRMAQESKNKAKETASTTASLAGGAMQTPAGSTSTKQKDSTLERIKNVYKARSGF